MIYKRLKLLEERQYNVQIKDISNVKLMKHIEDYD